MKFKQLFAAILSALMIVSCFSFTASAQDATVNGPIFVTSANNGTFTNCNTTEAIGGCGWKTNKYDEENDVVFRRFTAPEISVSDQTANTGSFFFQDYSGKASNDTGTFVIKVYMRSSFAGTPSVKANNTTDGSYNTWQAINEDGSAYTATPDEWEEVYFTGTLAKDSKKISNCLFYLGGDKTIGSYYDEDGNVVDWVDLAAYGFFNTMEDAKAYEFFVGDPIEEEGAVYIDSVNGNDSYVGTRSDYAVKTLAKANELLKKDGFDTLYVVGNVDGTGTPGISDKKIYIQGYSGKGTEVLSFTGHYKFGGDIEFSNIVLCDSDGGDGEFLAQGHDITFNENVTVKSVQNKVEQNYSYIGQGYYNSFSNINSTVNLNGGNWSRFYFGAVTGATITGKAIWNIGGNAKVNNIYTGHGSGTSTQVTKGETYINVNGGTISIDVGGSQSGPKSSHIGLRYFTLNGGTVTKLNTRTKSADATYEGITVFEINDGVTLPDSIGETSGTTDDSETRIVIFNNGVDAKTVEDEGAIVLDVDGGNVKAIASATADGTSTFSGFSYELDDEDYNAVKIGDETIKLSTLATAGVIPADYFEAGLNTVEFVSEDFSAEPEHIASFREQGYEIVYVGVSSKGSASGDTPENAYGDLVKASTAFENVPKVVYAVVGTYYSTNNIETFRVGAGQKVVITSGDGTPLHIGGQMKFLANRGADILFDNIEIVYGGIYTAEGGSTPTDVATGDRMICAHANDITIGANTTFTGAKAGDNVRTVALQIIPFGDGGAYSNTDTVKVTLLAGTNLLPRSGNYNGTKSTGSVEYIFAGNVNVPSTTIGGHNTPGADDANRTIAGDLLATVKENAHIGTLGLNGNFIYNGNAVINVIGGTVDTLTIQCNNYDAKIGKIKGDTVVYYTGGQIKAIGAGNDRAGEIRAFVADTDKVTMPTIDAASALTHVVSYNGNNGKVTFDAANDVFNIAPAEGVKYVRITNGTDVKEYNVAGEEVELMADLSAIALAAGTTTVEFLTEGTENPEVTTANAIFDANGGSWGGETTKTVATTIGEVPVAPEKAPEREGFTFKGWTPELSAITAAGATYTAVWEEIVVVVNNKVYLSDAGNDGNDGFSADKAVKTIAKANEIMAANATVNTFVIVNAFTASVRFNDVGVAGRELTITGNTSDAIFRIDWPKDAHSDKKDTDDYFFLLCPVKFENIALYGDTNDGRIITNGHKVEFGTGVKNAGWTVNVAVQANSSNAQIIIQSGEYSRVFPGVFGGGTFAGNSTVVVDGAGTKIATIGLGHGWHESQYFDGKLNVTINDGTVNTIKLQANGTSAEAENGYRGLRYFTLNGGTVGDIVTTSGPVWRADKAPDYSNIEYRTGVTVFEINEADIVTGTIDRGFNINGEAKVDDDATRIIIFNNGSYEEGKVLDTGAITANVIGGKLKANVTVAQDGYTTTLGDYTFEVADEAYDRVTITPATGEAKTYVLSEITAISTADLVAGTNKVEFFKYEEEPAPTTATLKFYDGDTLFVEKTVDIGATLNIVPLMSDVKGGNHATYTNDIPARPSKKGYYLEGWSATNGGEVTTVTATADASYYAVWSEAPVLAEDDYTLVRVDGTEVTASPVPADATGFRRGDANNSFATTNKGTKFSDNNGLTNYMGVTIGTGTNTNIASWFGGGTQKTIVAPSGTNAIWYKFQDEYISVKPGVEGEYNIAYWMYSGNAGDTRAFTLETPGHKGVVYLAGEDNIGGLKPDQFVIVQDTLTADSELKYYAALDFEDSTVKGGQLLGIYVWPVEEEVTTANAIFDANGGTWGDETTKTVVTTIGEVPVAPVKAPEKEGFTFKGWTPELSAITAEGATYKAVWEEIVVVNNKVYLSDNGNDENDGLTAEKPVKTLSKANSVMAASEDIDTVVIVGYFTTNTNNNQWGYTDSIGVAGRNITITGDTAAATLDYSTGSDNCLGLLCNATFKNITIKAHGNDGTTKLNGFKVVYGEGVTMVDKKLPKISGESAGAQLEINSGAYSQLLAAGITGNTTVNGDVTYVVNGGSVELVSIGKAYQGARTHNGKYIFTLNGGSVGEISLRGNGNNAANAYSGLRYFTINDGTVGNIVTTSRNKYGKDLASTLAENKRTGITVFEINKKGALTGTAALNDGVVDEAKRIIIFNNGAFEEGKVLDTGAITANVIGGALKADVTMAADYATTLNGYTFTAADDEYDRVTITPATGEAKTYVLSEITAIPAADLVAGTNRVVFFKYVEEAVEVDVVFDANGGAWADGDTTKVVKTLESEVPVAPTEAPVQAGYTFKGWTPEFAPVTADGATYKAVWEKVYTKIYISNNGKNSNDGLTPETAVRSLSTANTLLARDGIDTLVVVGTFTSEKDADTLGVAGKHITVTGQDANALFEVETYLKNDKGDNIDDDLVLAGPVTFKNIKIKDGSGDGVIQARGNKVVFDEGVAFGGDSIEVAGWSGNNDITIKSGSYGRVFPGTVSGTYNGGTTNINISGGTVSAIGLGHGWRDSNVHNGAVYVTVDGGTIKDITLRSGGDKAANTYRGLRYYTINDGTVANIITTGGSQYYNNATVAARTGATVFEINKAGVVTGNIALGTNVLTGVAEQDDATRIIIFNNNSYKAGQVTDTGAITVEVRNGTLKADVTMATDYTTTLNGYTFTTEKSKVNINGTNYEVASFDGVIPADKLVAGYNLVFFTDVDIVNVKWVVGDKETTALVEVGAKLTAPAVTLPATTKDNYYTLDGWKIGEEAVDFATFTVPAGGATITAVLTAHEMPASATFDFTGVSAPNNKPFFTGEAVTYKGVEAVKVTPGANVTETTINIEGWEKWPLNKSYPANEKFVNTAIYPYVAVRYFYVPGTAEGLTTGFWINSNNTFEGNNGTTITVDGGAAEAGKWTYAVYDLSATNMANKVSRQYWVQGLKGMTLGDMNKAGVEYYIDTLTIYKDAPTVATITFKAEDGATLYAIDAINGEAVAFYGEAPTKENHTFLGWAIEGTTEIVDTFAFTANTTLVPVFEENAPIVPEDPEYKTYGNYNALTGKYTVELTIAGGVFNQGAFGFNFPTEQMTFVSATANEEAGIKFLTGTPVTETDAEGYYAAAWYATEDISGKADASADELTLVTFEFTMTPAQREAFVAAGAALTEYVNAEPADIAAFAKYHNGTNYLVAPHEAGPSVEREAVVYAGHTDVEEENEVEYTTHGIYDAVMDTYSIDVKVFGGKFNLGAFGLAFDDQYMTYDPDDENALVLAEDIANYLGVTLANTAEGVAFVWDGSKIEGAGYIDATNEEVLIATIKTTMTDEQRAAFVAADMPMSILEIDNADYFANGNYLVRPYTDGLDTPKVEAIYTAHSDEEAEITTAAVTIKVTFEGKVGATAANLGYISINKAEPIVIDAAGNTEATVEYVINDAVIGEELEIEIFKNGYLGSSGTYTVQADANVIEVTTIPGDIKGATDALEGDGKVSLDDFVRVIRAFDSAASEAYKASVDLDESGAVNVTDIGLIKTNFGKTTDDVKVVINGNASMS